MTNILGRLFFSTESPLPPPPPPPSIADLSTAVAVATAIRHAVATANGVVQGVFMALPGVNERLAGHATAVCVLLVALTLGAFALLRCLRLTTTIGVDCLRVVGYATVTVAATAYGLVTGGALLDAVATELTPTLVQHAIATSTLAETLRALIGINV